MWSTALYENDAGALSELECMITVQNQHTNHEEIECMFQHDMIATEQRLPNNKVNVTLTVWKASWRSEGVYTLQATNAGGSFNITSLNINLPQVHQYGKTE